MRLQGGSKTDDVQGLSSGKQRTFNVERKTLNVKRKLMCPQ